MSRAQAASDRGRDIGSEPHSRREAEVADFFDAFAHRYDAAYGLATTSGRVLRQRLQAVLELVGERPGDVLDAGMGGGVVCVELARRGWTPSGVDISPRMVELARTRLPDARERLVEGSILALPYEDASFDAAIAMGVLEYVAEDLAEAVRELARALRPGGIAVVSLPNYGSVQTMWRFRVFYPSVRITKRALGLTPPPVRRIITLAELRAVLSDAGLRVQRVETVGVRWLPHPLADRVEGSRSRLLRTFGTQFVLRADKLVS